MPYKKSSLNSEQKKLAGIAIVVLVLGVMFWGVNSIRHNKTLAAECLDLQNTEGWEYPAVCFPTKKTTATGDIKDKTNSYCTCVLDMGNNQTYVAEILISK